MAREEECTCKSSLEHLQILAAHAGVAANRALATECVQTSPTASRRRSSKVEESRLSSEKEKKEIKSGKVKSQRDGRSLKAPRPLTHILFAPYV